MVDALEADCKLHKWVGIHGIRWMASKARCVGAFLANWECACINLHMWAMIKARAAARTIGWSASQLGEQTFSLATPSDDLVGKLTFQRVFEVSGRRRDFKGTVLSVVSAEEVRQEATLDSDYRGEYFKIKYPGDKDEEELTKGEILWLYSQSYKAFLQNDNKEWDLFWQLTDARTLFVAHFLLDLDTVLSIGSLQFQKNTTTLADVRSTVSRMIKDVTDLGTKDGRSLALLRRSIKSDDPFDKVSSHRTYHGIVIHDYDEAVSEFKSMRLAYTSSVARGLKSRFDESNDPVYSASAVFDPPFHSVFLPQDNAHAANTKDIFLSSYGNVEIKVLVDWYAPLLLGIAASKIPPDASGAQNPDGPFTYGNEENLLRLIQLDWSVFKQDLVDEASGLGRFQYTAPMSEFWNVYVRQRRQRYPHLFLLVELVFLIPIGTAECERIFSALNALKDDVHNRRQTDVLNDWITCLRLGPGRMQGKEADIDWSAVQPHLGDWIQKWHDLCNSERRPGPLAV